MGYTGQRTWEAVVDELRPEDIAEIKDAVAAMAAAWNEADAEGFARPF